MSRFWNARTRALCPYVPGEQPKDGQRLIKLNTNENPYPPSPAVVRALRDFDPASLRLYPDADGAPARAAFAERAGLTAREVFVGNGSDEVLAIAFQAFFGEGEPLLLPAVSYSFYPVYCQLYGIEYQAVPMNADFSIAIEGFLRPGGGVVLANPNAPTTLALELPAIRRILEAHPDEVVLIDEAYVDFGAQSALSLVREYENLLVVQTCSKSRSLAGLRVGFAAGNPALIEGLDRVKNSFNSYTLDRLAIACATASFTDEAYFADTVAKIVATRARTAARLRDLGFTVLDSKTNFLFITHPRAAASELMAALKAQGILVRYFAQPPIDRYLRVTVGTDGEMEALCTALEALVG